MGGVPFPHGGPNGEWRYRHAVTPAGPTALDHQAVADFIAYETAHDRSVTVSAAPQLSGWRDWPTPGQRPAPASFPIQCCSHVYPAGCGADLVCHGALYAVALRIAGNGVLRPATAVTGLSGVTLTHASSWGEPADYFDHVMFANGRCTAPEAVAASRSLGRDLVPSDLARGYTPAVRLYFRWADLARRADARFDGVHPVKILGALPLSESLVAVVVPVQHHDEIADELDARLRDRVIGLDITKPEPDEWATAAFESASAARRDAS